MDSFLIALLTVVLVLVLIRYILDAVGLAEPANKIIWIVCVIVGVLYLISGHTFLR